MKRLLLLLWLIVGLALQAHSCSIGPGPDFLSNYEMVKAADAIVLAHSQEVASSKEPHFPLLRFQIKEVIKGYYPSKTLVDSVGSTDDRSYRGRSSSDDFSRARPGTYAGACTALDFRLNADYLLFLTKVPKSQRRESEQSEWEIGVQILSRDREEVDGEDDLWTGSVKRYIQIANLHNYEKEKAALADLRELAAKSENKGVPPALASDINRHFAAASRMKSYTDLMTLYEAATEDRRRDAAVYAMAAAKYPQAFDLIYKRFGGANVEYFGAVKNPRSISILADQLRRIKARAGYSGEVADIAKLLAQMATQRDTPLMMNALRAANPKDYESEILALWFVQHPSPQGTTLLRQLVGTQYEEKSRLADALAMLDDKNIIRWAAANALTPDYLIPVYMLGYSPLPEADHAAQQIIASGDTRRVDILVYAYRSDKARYNPHRWNRLRQIAALRKRARAPTNTRQLN